MSWITDIPISFARNFLEGDNMSEELKPCPFCKGEAEESIIHNITSGISVIVIMAKCKDCGATMLCEALEGCDFQDLEFAYGELVEKWNRRADVRD